MSFQKRVKHCQRAAARNTLVFFYHLINWLPFPVVKFIMGGCLWIAFHFTIKLKRIARETLNVALGNEKTPREIEDIIRRCFDNLREGMIELLYYSRYPQRVKEIFTLEGREHLDRALAKGKGVMAVTAHFGNFPLMMLALAQHGYRVNVIMRRARDEKAGDIVLDIMTRVQVNTVYSLPRRQCVTDSLRVLRENEILFILMDQNFGSGGGVFVDFFGQKAATATGPVVFASRAECPVVPMFNVREKGGQHRVLIEPEMPMEKRDDHDEMVLTNVSRLTNIIERYIRKYPEEWGWMHRRFKSQARAASPSGENLQGSTGGDDDLG